MRRNQLFNIAPKTTGIEDTYRTLTAITFYVGVNNSSKIFAITNVREKICMLSVPVGAIIPWLNVPTILELFALQQVYYNKIEKKTFGFSLP